MNTKVIALAAVIIVVVAAIGVGVVLKNNDKDSKNDDVSIDAPVLQVFGNANGDYYLDDKDVTVLKDLVKNQPSDWKTTNYFADTDCNGSLEEADVTMLQSILDATADNKVSVNVLSYALTKSYNSTIRYPITAAACNTNQTTMILLKTLGIDSQIVATSVASSNTNSDGTVKTASYDKYIFGSYFDVMDSAHQIGSKSADVVADKATKIVSDYKCSCYIYSSSNSVLTNAAAVGTVVDMLQISDGMSSIADFGSALLLVGFLFDTGSDGFIAQSVKAVDWFVDYTKQLQERLSKVTTKVSAVASSMSTYISIKGSSNTDIIEQAGLYCPVAKTNPTSGSSMTMTYDGTKDTWLNMIDLDSVVVLKGSTSGWSWFDKDYSASDLPSSFKTHVENFKTLSCYKDGDVVVLSTMMPGSLKSGALAEYFYSDCFEKGWFDGIMTDFLTTFWGFTAEQCTGQKYILTQQEVLGTS